MDWMETGNTAITSLGANRLRSALMLIGIIIGVAAVIIVVAIGLAGQKRIEKELETFGSGSVWIWRDWDDRNTEKDNFWTSNDEISNSDVGAIKVLCPDIINLSPTLFASIKVGYNNERKDARIIGVTSSYQTANNEKLASGRFLTGFDDIYLHRVCVLSSTARMNIVKNTLTPTGKYIVINNEKFMIVGVLEKKDREFLETIRAVNGSSDDIIYIPLAVIQDWYNTKNISLLQGQTTQGKSSSGMKEIEEILVRRHHKNIKFKTESMEQYVKVSNRIMGTLSIVLSAIAAISLFVGGLGVMNVMLISVTERTREIGIRKAVGATKKDIIYQFLTESVMISILGGGIGILLGILGVIIISILSNISGLLSIKPIFIAFFASTIVGILAGIYPANRAAEMDTIEALRFE